MATSRAQVLGCEAQLLSVSTNLVKCNIPPGTNAVPADMGVSSVSPAGADQTAGKKQPRKRRRRTSADGDTALAPKKRRLTEEQVASLELSFGAERGLDSDRKVRIAEELGLDTRQVAVWFQNRRARWRGKRLEEDHARLHAALEDAALHNRRLETEVLELRQQLGEAQKELARLSTSTSSVPPVHAVSAEVSSGGSPSCSALSTLVDPADASASSAARHSYYCSHLPLPPSVLLGELREEEDELLCLGGGVTDVCSIYDNGIWDWTL